jgi:hypothetical protein
MILTDGILIVNRFDGIFLLYNNKVALRGRNCPIFRPKTR